VSQTKLIYEYLKRTEDGITPLDALEKFGCFRLSARIADLRDEGHNIVTLRETKNGKTYARYKLERSEDVLV